MEEMRNVCDVLSENHKAREKCRDVFVRGRIILKCCRPNDYRGRKLTGSICPTVTSSGIMASCGHGNESSVFIK